MNEIVDDKTKEPYENHHHHHHHHHNIDAVWKVPSTPVELDSVSTYRGNIYDIYLAKRILFVSHSIGQLATVSWQFSIPILLSALTEFKSLFFVSSYGIVSGSLILICNTSVLGNFIDSSHYSRSTILTRLLFGQMTCAILASLFCYHLFQRVSILQEHTSRQQDDDTDATDRSENITRPLVLMTDTYFGTIMIGLHLFGGLGKALDKAITIALEKDWVVVMSEELDRVAHSNRTILDDERNEMGNGGDEEDEKQRMMPSSSIHMQRRPTVNGSSLTQINAQMKQIDLGSKFIGPTIAGFMMQAFDQSMKSMSKASLVIGVLQVFSIVFEYIATRWIYQLVPTLSIKRNKNKECSADSSSSSCLFYSNVVTYFIQTYSLSGLSLSLVYSNILTLTSLMSAYLVSIGMSLGSVGIWRGVASIIGLLGALLYPLLVKRIGIVSTGLCGVIILFGVLTVSYISLIFVSSSKRTSINDWSVIVLVVSVCISRIGRFLFELSVSQLLQIYTAAEVRGVVGAVQESLNAFFDMQLYIFGIFFSDTSGFVILAAIGYFCVVFSACLYMHGVFRFKWI